MSLKWPFKDPDEKLDYTVDWTARIDTGDSISTSVWTVPADLTSSSPSFTATTTTIWLQGGIEGNTYDILNHITTAGGRIMEQTVKLHIKSK